MNNYDSPKELVAAHLTSIFFSKIDAEFLRKYNSGEQQNEYVKEKIIEVYQSFLSKLDEQTDKKL